MPVVTERLVVVALQVLGNKVIFDLTNLRRRQDWVLGARHHPPWARLRFFIPLFEDRRTPLFEFVQQLPRRL